MSAYSDNFWAEEMAINLEELETERPTHPYQVKLRRKQNRKADKYWANHRFLAKYEVPSSMIPLVKQPEQVEVKREPEIQQAPVKSRKVRGYEFTDRQLEIAAGVLDAQDSVRALRV